MANKFHSSVLQNVHPAAVVGQPASQTITRPDHRPLDLSYTWTFLEHSPVSSFICLPTYLPAPSPTNPEKRRILFSLRSEEHEVGIDRISRPSRSRQTDRQWGKSGVCKTGLGQYLEWVGGVVAVTGNDDVALIFVVVVIVGGIPMH